jgi:hypothetical protein
MPKPLKIQFPAAGVVRRRAESAQLRAPYPTPWAVNVQSEDAIERRLRGGSRLGLTKLVSEELGDSIADMASLNLKDGDDLSEVLFVLVDAAVKTITNGTVDTLKAYLTDESGNNITDELGEPIVVGSDLDAAYLRDEDGNIITDEHGDPIISGYRGFLVTGKQLVFAVTRLGVTKYNPATGQIDDLTGVPSGCTFGAIYRDRLWLAGYNNVIHVSRHVHR